MRNIISFSSHSNGKTFTKALTIFFVLACLTTLSGAFQPARADSDWISLLKPLVQDVVMPVVKQQMTHWQSKMGEKLVGQTPVVSTPMVEAASITPPPVTPLATTTVAPVTTPSPVTSSAAGWEWKSPEEP